MMTAVETALQKFAVSDRALGPLGQAIRKLREQGEFRAGGFDTREADMKEIARPPSFRQYGPEESNTIHRSRPRPAIGFRKYLATRCDNIRDYIEPAELEDLKALTLREKEIASHLANCDARKLRVSYKKLINTAPLEQLDELDQKTQELLTHEESLRRRRYFLKRHQRECYRNQGELLASVIKRLAAYFEEELELYQDIESDMLEEWGTCAPFGSNPVHYAAFYWWECFRLGDRGGHARTPLIEALLDEPAASAGHEVLPDESASREELPDELTSGEENPSIQEVQ